MQSTFMGFFTRRYFSTEGELLPRLPERAALANPLPALRHQLQHDVEGGFVVVEDDYVLAGVGQL